MKERRVFKFRNHLILILACALVWLSHFNSAVAGTNSAASLVANETAFAFDLYHQLKDGDGNLFFSPYSISTCLGMTYVGARGKTATQMAKVLHFNMEPEELPASISLLEKQLNEIRESGDVELNTANGLWAQTGHPFLPGYLETCQRDFDARIAKADFRSAATQTANEINEWVGVQTKNRITHLVSHETITDATALVLVNAIYFKGAWLRPFEKTATTNLPFTISKGQTVEAPLMRRTADFAYAETSQFQLLEMGYRSLQINTARMRLWGGRLAMGILLPKKMNGLKQLEKSLNEAMLSQWLVQLRPQKVEVFLPRFKMTAEFNLTQSLTAMGMAEPLSETADFSGMDAKRDLFISTFVHQAFVDVNEEGTEAAAASGTRMVVNADELSIPVFRADHPFIFYIRDTQSGCILFLGRVTDPTK